MRKLTVFNHLTLDGYFSDKNGEVNWAKSATDDTEFNAFVSENASGASEFLFGRKTYELMASYWPSPHALENSPVVAKKMNEAPKTVFSRTLTIGLWNNTKLIKKALATEVRQMKEASGPDIVVFGSGTLVTQLAQENLIDQYQIVVNPIVLGEGRSMFEGIKKKLSLKLIRTRPFNNGCVFLSYEPIL